jgi:hypothetical protein
MKENATRLAEDRENSMAMLETLKDVSFSPQLAL